ncbi:hypothetical protein [Agromyces seonyuensis]|uniref:SRPBCC family protein n=1 Tax=Agromyces seonyuensis TaxID=2662446 RepID=A0A6I4P0X5_9MICO|nr:hypothetical protein [Agromyces seonyuensis]MWC00197.1 hypothetical protein [Agromyces seonyuensis]
MRVLLKLDLDAPPDTVWAALQSPAVLREVVRPWLDFESLEPGGFPERWGDGVHRLRVLAFGRRPVGLEHVDVSRPGGLPEGVRMLRDAGGADTGPLAALREWDHRMAVSALPDGRTRYRDRLLASTGNRLLDLLFVVPIWTFWQWRAWRMRRLAPGWAARFPGRSHP